MINFRLLVVLALTITGPCAQAFPLYYDISDCEKAQLEARNRNLPLAWLGGFAEVLSMSSTHPGSPGEAQQIAITTLQNNAVIIFFDGKNMALVPALVHAQFHIHDDGQLPGGADWNRPKVVFTNPEVTQILGRVSETEIHAEGDVALNSALQIIRNNPTALALPQSPSASSRENTATTEAENRAGLSGFSTAWAVMKYLSDNALYLGVGIVCVVGLLFWLIRSHHNV